MLHLCVKRSSRENGRIAVNSYDGAPDNPTTSPHKVLQNGGQKSALGNRTKCAIISIMKRNRVVALVTMIGLAALIIMLIFTSPTELGPLGVLVFFTTLYVTVFGFIALVLRAFYRLAFNRNNFRNKDYLYSAVMAFGPIMMLMARAFGAVSLWTVVLIILFLALAEFLVYKRV